MTSNEVINAEQKNKHKIMKDVHIDETDCWKEQISIFNDVLTSQWQIQICKLERNKAFRKNTDSQIM